MRFIISGRESEVYPICNLYSVTKDQTVILEFTRLSEGAGVLARRASGTRRPFALVERVRQAIKVEA